MQRKWRQFAVALLVLQFCLAAASHPGKGQELGADKEAVVSGQTGTGTTADQRKAAKNGGADGLGNPLLGRERHPLYRLNRSDVVAISFTLSPEFDQLLTVQPDGYVTLKDAGMVQAEGLTLGELAAAVRSAYRGYLHDPQVAVSLKDFEHPFFIAGGEVGRPGKYELRSNLTVAEAVQIAGGFTHQARHSQVVLFRHAENGLIEAHLFDVKKMLKQKEMNEDAELQPGDMVYVPQNAISKIAQYLTKPSLSMYVSSTDF
jgi:polysaccharide export outer membrane protein